jgi:hypothetical protein
MDRTYLFTVTTPAGTPIGAPVTTPMPLEDAGLEALRIVIPAGHVGVTGIRLLRSGQQIFPWANLQYLVGNDRVVDIPFSDNITASGLVAITYNTGTFSHNHYVEVVVKDLPVVNPALTSGQSVPAVLPVTAPAVLDPLSPDALLASLPADLTEPPVLDLAAIGV